MFCVYSVQSDIKTLERPSIRQANGSEINETLIESSAFNVHVLHEGAICKIGDGDVSYIYSPIHTTTVSPKPQLINFQKLNDNFSVYSPLSFMISGKLITYLLYSVFSLFVLKRILVC